MLSLWESIRYPSLGLSKAEHSPRHNQKWWWKKTFPRSQKWRLIIIIFSRKSSNATCELDLDTIASASVAGCVRVSLRGAHQRSRSVRVSRSQFRFVSLHPRGFHVSGHPYVLQPQPLNVTMPRGCRALPRVTSID